MRVSGTLLEAKHGYANVGPDKTLSELFFFYQVSYEQYLLIS